MDSVIQIAQVEDVHMVFARIGCMENAIEYTKVIAAINYSGTLSISSFQGELSPNRVAQSST